MSRSLLLFFFFFNDTATTEIYTLSLHDALPISPRDGEGLLERRGLYMVALRASSARRSASAVGQRSSGSFSSDRITQAPRSSGTSGRRSVISGGRSVMCFIRIPGTVGAWKGSSPASIWYATTPKL